MTTPTHSGITPTPIDPEDRNHRRAVLDTSVQVDRVKSGQRSEWLATILNTFGWRFTTGIALLEFKATLLQEMIFIHDSLRRPGARFSHVRDEITESQHRQKALRLHIFNNILAISASSHRTAEADDLRLAEKAHLLLEDHIVELYDWFVGEKSVDQLLSDRVRCDRAAERPVKKRAKFATNLPECIRGRNKSCRVESVLREKAAPLRSRLEALATPVGEEPPNQFRKSLTVIDRVVDDPKAELSHGDCRRAGDLLIGLEAHEFATHAISTNAKEWQQLSEILGFEFVHIAYPRST